MRKKLPAQSLINESAEHLLHMFLTEKYISDPLIFGLGDFSIQELIKNSFEMTGDDFYRLYEKTYRMVGSGSQINLKVYFNNEKFISNGVDFLGGRISTCLFNFYKSHYDANSVNSIELLLSDSLDNGSLIINQFLDVRFGKSRWGKKKKFHLTGISTDYEIPSNKIEKNSNTHAARIMKDEISFQRALKIFEENSAIRDVAMCVMKNFPCAVSPIEYGSP